VIAVRLRPWLLLLIAALPASPRAGEDVLPEPLKSRLGAFKVETLKAHEAFLTSEECAGRDTPQRGLTRARDYLVEMHQKFGMTGAAAGGGFLFDFEVPAYTFGDDDSIAVVRGADGKDAVEFKPGVDFVPVRNSASGTVDGEVVFGGYGITDSDERWDDLKGVDVKGKVVAVLLHEPREGKKGARFKGVDWTRGGAITEKWRAAQEKGASAVVVFTDPANHAGLGALECELPRYGSLPEHAGTRSGASNDGGKPAQEGKEPAIPVVHASGAIADALFGAGKLLEWQRAIDASLKPAPRAIAGVRVRLKVGLVARSMTVQDVVSCKRGSDKELADEWIVVGAHYDHVGVDPFGRVFHGADDNGSGTSCLLQIAEAIGDPKVTFKRSVLLIHFAGEEKGLLGAAAFCKRPLMPADRIVTMINMDMVGRGRPHDIDAAGLKNSDDLAALVRRAVKLSRTRLAVGDGGMQFFQRSDQYEFWRLGIPVLFFMEPKEHEDYHQVTDTMDKIVYPKVVDTARVVTCLIDLLSNIEQRPRQEGIK